MFSKKTAELDFEFPEQDKKSKRPSKRFTKIFLITSAGVLVAALAVAAVLLLGSPQAVVRIMDFGTALEGVSVGGVDISGMTREQALFAAADVESQLLDKANFSVDINKDIKNFSAKDFALYTDYEIAVGQALEYGRMGSFDERLNAAKDAKETGADFPVKVFVDEAGLKAALKALKAGMDTAPADATATFAPWGYTQETATDGTVTYKPVTFDTSGLVKMCSTISKNKEYTSMPERALIPDTEMPNKLRYEYWNDRKNSKSEKAKGGYGNKHGAYEEDNVPRDWNVSRFIYTEEKTGLVVDIAAIETAVKSQVESGAYETIVAPVEVTPAKVTLEQLKGQTQLIASWSSSYGGSGHKGEYSRNYNVSMMAYLLNGSVIEPGQIWSVNETVGKRSKDSPYRWKEAKGIENGAYTAQLGGGVCQLGSTTYNAAIRSGLVATEHHHHSIPSEYIPLGLDATINSTNYDFKLRNDAATPVYLVAYTNPSKQYVTVEFYGVPLTDAAGQQIIYTFMNKYLGRFGSPKSVVKEVDPGFECPDETVISLNNPEHKHSDPRRGTKAMAYRITMSLDGKQIGSKEEFEKWSYPKIDGLIYKLKAKYFPTPSLSTDPAAPPA